jgi:hypothetical protein
MRSNNGHRLERNRKFVDSPLERGGFELLVPQFSTCCVRPAFLRRISARLSKELDGFRRTPRFRQGHR